MKNCAPLLGLVCSLCLLAGCGGGSAAPQQDKISPPALFITSSTLPNGTVGAAYGGSGGFFLTASGGKAPYSWTWAAASGSSLPPGLDISGNAITGTPNAANTYRVVVTVTDSESPAVHTGANYTITIAPPAALAI